MRLLLVGVFITFSLSFGQQPSDDVNLRYVFLPGRLAFPPLTAHHQEPRVGVRKEFGSSKMKVDIGASVDMLEVRPASDSTERFRVGVDFFTFALSTNSQGLRLQIDAVDGFFGGHVMYLNDVDERRRVVVRLRLLHLSAHFLDGHFNNGTESWKDNRAPIAFTRDFGELLALYQSECDDIAYHVYGGFSYATLLRPTNINRFEYAAGFEVRSASLVESVFGKPFNMFLAHHVTLRGIPTYIGSTNVDFGVKFGHWNSTGLKMYLSWFNGLDFFSQYYDVRREHWALGFAFDFW